MRFAVPVVGGTLSAHFGHCEQFALIDVDDNTKKILGTKFVASPGHEPGLLPAWLSGQGVTVVVAGGMGSRAQSLFNQNGVEVVTGATGVSPQKLVEDYLRGSLVTDANFCDH